MSARPPRSTNDRSIPGYLIVLAALSLLLLLFSVAMGLVAFGVIRIGDPTPTPSGSVEGQVLQQSGFTVNGSTLNGRERTVDITIDIINTGDESIHNAEIMVQCTDGGNVAATQRIDTIEPGQQRQFHMRLLGTGDPACAAPIVGIDVPLPVPHNSP